MYSYLTFGWAKDYMFEEGQQVTDDFLKAMIINYLNGNFSDLKPTSYFHHKKPMEADQTGSFVHKEFQAVYDPKVGLIKTLLKIYWKDLGLGRFSEIIKFNP